MQVEREVEGQREQQELREVRPRVELALRRARQRELAAPEDGLRLVAAVARHELLDKVEAAAAIPAAAGQVHVQHRRLVGRAVPQPHAERGA